MTATLRQPRQPRQRTLRRSHAAWKLLKRTLSLNGSHGGTVFQKPRLAILSLIVAIAATASAQDRRPASGEKWAATWAASVHGPYPSGNPSAQPDLKYAFPDPA